MDSSIDSDPDSSGYRMFKKLVSGCVLAALLYFSCAYYFIARPKIHERMCRYEFVRQNGIEIELVRICTDTGVPKIWELIPDSSNLNSGTDEEIIARHTQLVREILENGKKANVELKDIYRQRLATSYKKVAQDIWKHPYVFYIVGPTDAPQPELQKKLMRVYSADIQEVDPIEFAKSRLQNMPGVFIISTGRDGLLGALAAKPGHTAKGMRSQVGDDVTNLLDVPFPGA